jgi:hypothetical protein
MTLFQILQNLPASQTSPSPMALKIRRTRMKTIALSEIKDQSSKLLRLAEKEDKFILGVGTGLAIIKHVQ